MPFFNRPKIAELQKQKERMEVEAKAREEKRAEAELEIAQKEAVKVQEARQSEERHKEIERKVWLKQISAAHHQIRAAQRLNCITAIAAIVALGGLFGVIVTVYDSRVATVYANRAWIEATSMEVTGPIKANTVLPIDVYYSNVGKGPALGMTVAFTPARVSATGDPETILIFPNSAVCTPSAPGDGAVDIFPDAFAHHWVVKIPGAAINSDDETRKTALLLEGCVKYNTIGESHRTIFCFVIANGAATASRAATAQCIPKERSD